MANRTSHGRAAELSSLLCMLAFSPSIADCTDVPQQVELRAGSTTVRSAFETGDAFVPHNLAVRLMRRYTQMGNNENITYPARVFDMDVSDEQAEAILAQLSIALSYITEGMYNHYGFMVKSVTFVLEANGAGPSESGDPMPLNIALGHWWAMGYARNQFYAPADWALDPHWARSGIFHEFAHHFLLRHLDLNDGYEPRSTMDTPGGDTPTDYALWGGDDLAGAIHMWRYSTDPSAPPCPELYTLSTVGVTGASFPDAEPYGDGTWRCDPDGIDRHGLLIKNKSNARCIGTSDASDETGVSVSTCNHADAEQQWDLVADDDGSFRVRNVSSGNCLQVSGSSLSSGAAIEQYACNAADSSDATQKFYPIADGSGHYSIRAELSGRFLSASGDIVIQETPDGTDTQRWQLSLCGNGTCDPSEDVDSCESDCGDTDPNDDSCGDGVCDSNEDADSCEADCGDDGQPDDASASGSDVDTTPDINDPSVGGQDPHNDRQYSTEGSSELLLPAGCSTGETRSIPLGGLIVALGALCGWSWRRRSEKG